MKTYIKIENGVVKQKQNYPQKGFVEAPSDVVCEQIQQEDGSYINPPPAPLTWEQEREAEYAIKGWNSPYGVIDDMLARGNAAVKADRDAIKLKHPKGA